LAKSAVKSLLALLRQWKDAAGLLSAQSGRGGSTSIQKQIKFCHQLGTLRQFVVEALAVPVRKEVGK
jgi:hypothetical protein